jgi:hypothetical protein
MKDAASAGGMLGGSPMPMNSGQGMQQQPI